MKFWHLRHLLQMHVVPQRSDGAGLGQGQEPVFFNVDRAELSPDGVGSVGDVVRAHLCDSKHESTNTH